MENSYEKANLKLNNPFILASGSPRRKELLSEIISEFKVIPSTAVEIKSHSDGPLGLVCENARLKAETVSQENHSCWVLGADTLVFLGDQPFGKPNDMSEAVSMLSNLSGKSHTVATGICLKCAVLGREKIFADQSVVTFKDLKTEDIEAYFQKVNPLDKAGGYAIQTCPEMIIDKFEGSLSNVIGLPIEKLRKQLNDLLNSLNA
ncbi:Maf family protein [Opitutales bacterium]|nr:Maf family protein [Opitutales bacterium]